MTATTSSTTATPLKVIIVGAGIGGLSAAIALREHDVTVYEQSRMKTELGAAIHLASNASKICLKWGMELKNLGSPKSFCYTENSKDMKTMFAAPRLDCSKIFGGPWLLNHRVDLHNELRRMAEDDTGSIKGKKVTIKTSHKVVKVDCEAGKIDFEDGSSDTADVIIGADGIHSVVRTAVLGFDYKAKPSGHSAYRTLIPREKIINDEKFAHLLTDTENAGITTYVGADKRIVAYPCRKFEYLNIVAIVPDTFLHEESTESWTAQVSADDAVAAFSDFSPDLKRLLSYSDKVGLWQLRDQDPLPTWVKGKAIIIADAAHAMLPHQGQGGGQSVEDAEACGVFLSGFTHADADKVPERLALIQKVRMERATKVQGYSREKAIGPREGETGGAINAHEFIGYNMGYNGALDWAKKIGVELPSDLSVPEATTTTTSQVTKNVAGLKLNGNGAAAASTAAAATSTEVPSESTAAVPSLAAIAA